MFFAETIPHCVFDKEEKVGRFPVLNFMIKVTVHSPMTIFWTVTFSIYRNVCLELEITVQSSDSLELSLWAVAFRTIRTQ